MANMIGRKTWSLHGPGGKDCTCCTDPRKTRDIQKRMAKTREARQWRKDEGI